MHPKDGSEEATFAGCRGRSVLRVRCRTVTLRSLRAPQKPTQSAEKDS